MRLMTCIGIALTGFVLAGTAMYSEEKPCFTNVSFTDGIA